MFKYIFGGAGGTVGAGGAGGGGVVIFFVVVVVVGVFNFLAAEDSYMEHQRLHLGCRHLLEPG